MEGRLLLVDDDKTALQLMRELLEAKGFVVDAVSSVKDAEEKLENAGYRAVVTDLKMPDRSGMDLLDHCRESFAETPVIMITGHGTIRNAVEALKRGAVEYLSKPIQMDELSLVIEKAISHRKLMDQNTFLKGELERTLGYHYETANDQLQSVYRTVEMIRDEETSVLIQGESGTGKEVIARLIHNSGRRAAGSFVPINCGAIPETLIESELFGFEKGAFTGAERRTPGKLEIADDGTLFLDEVNELPPKAQVALLRFIQERELTPLGSNRRVSVNVRIICATNTNLLEAVRQGLFREDLYYRIAVLPLTLPPLRERKQDILRLADFFLRRFKARSPRSAEIFGPAAKDALLRYEWPGNIRELRNCVDRASIMTQGQEIPVSALLLPHATPGDFSGIGKESPFELIGIRPLRELEKEYIDWVLDKTDGNRTKAADRLGVSVRGLRYKLNSTEVSDGSS